MKIYFCNRKVQENEDSGLQSGGDDKNSAADFDPTRQVCECVLHVTDSTNSLTIFFLRNMMLR